MIVCHVVRASQTSITNVFYLLPGNPLLTTSMSRSWSGLPVTLMKRPKSQWSLNSAGQVFVSALILDPHTPAVTGTVTASNSYLMYLV